MPTLKISSNSAANPQTLDLSPYLRLQPDQGTDPAGPAFTNRIFARSLLKEGATLALEQNVEREWTFPVAFKGTSQSVVNSTLVQQANQILETPGATLSWQDDGMSQPTVADILSGQVQIEYDYYRGRASWCNAKILIFTTPFGHPPAARAYAAASGVGPLLMISPYASGGALAIGASTQAGVAGFGGAPMGASSGIFYPGSPSLAGDAPALLQLSYAGLPIASQTLDMAFSVLPDANYRVLWTMNQFSAGGLTVNAQNAVASTYRTVAGSAAQFSAIVSAYLAPTNWSGLHRILAIARASSAGTPSAAITLSPADNSTVETSVAVNKSAWKLYDLGTTSLRPSEPQFAENTLLLQAPAGTGLDITALFSVPDATTWFVSGPSTMNFNNVIYLDDIVGDQFVYNIANIAAPSPSTQLSTGLRARISQYSRGTVPKPDPKNGLPIMSVIALPQTPSSIGVAALTSAQVGILERARYILP